MKIYKLRHKKTSKFLGSGETLDRHISEHKLIHGQGRTFTCIGHIKSMLKNHAVKDKPTEDQIAQFEVVMFEMVESTNQDLLSILKE